MDKARDILIRYDEGLLTFEEAILMLAILANKKEIPETAAIGFIMQIAHDEDNKQKEGIHGLPGTQADSS